MYLALRDRYGLRGVGILPLKLTVSTQKTISLRHKMWKELIFIIVLIFVFAIAGFVIFTLYYGTDEAQCALDSDCSSQQQCQSCNGVKSCQTKCSGGKTWDEDGCACVEPSTVNWLCETSGTLPYCNQSSTCDPSKDIGCYSGLASCSSGCYYGLSSDATPYYLYDPDTNKSDMIMYVFTSYPGDMSSYRHSTTVESMVLCDGSTPSGLESDESSDPRGVNSAFSNFGSAPGNKCCDICIENNCTSEWISSDYCPDSASTGSARAPAGERSDAGRSLGIVEKYTDKGLGDETHHYYFQNISSRMVCVDAYDESDSGNRIKITLDGTQECGRQQCLGKTSSSSPFMLHSVKVNGKDLYLATSTDKVTSPSGDHKYQLQEGYTCVFVDIYCQKLLI